ncbi:MAG TPA: Mut7-C RNAse domain-containing protein [Smithellaceae bacterium]|nr:Mut7-C RNAse domain-containing protein [Smithellaceae bacterium]HRS89622.1 Mut7-C RNAse domain-containing protein [Smithellaceae bacterium]HRV25822.1 Mut7-C RNAse domain-containing protein [Smithellaceae bacterium]
MSDCPKFVTDATLGKLAKWLRLLGYDTRVFPREAGRELLRLAQDENRIVLTKRADMKERQFAGIVLLLSHNDVALQLKEVIKKFSLKIEKNKMFGRCLKCNRVLEPIEATEVRELVPTYVFEHCQSFNRCPACRGIFWEGTHQRNSLQYLQKHGII